MCVGVGVFVGLCLWGCICVLVCECENYEHFHLSHTHTRLQLHVSLLLPTRLLSIPSSTPNKRFYALKFHIITTRRRRSPKSLSSGHACFRCCCPAQARRPCGSPRCSSALVRAVCCITLCCVSVSGVVSEMYHSGIVLCCFVLFLCVQVVSV